jgi:uncharacterized protein (DUF58 family)
MPASKTGEAMALSGSKNVTVLAMPVFMIAALIGFIAIFGKWGIAPAMTFWFLFVAALWVWSFMQLRRARREIRGQIELSGGKVIKMNYRYFRIGPFSIWNKSRSQIVYRVVVQEATGRERIVWAQWGRRWFWDPDTLELKWEGEAVQ